MTTVGITTKTIIIVIVVIIIIVIIIIIIVIIIIIIIVVIIIIITIITIIISVIIITIVTIIIIIIIIIVIIIIIIAITIIIRTTIIIIIITIITTIIIRIIILIINILPGPPGEPAGVHAEVDGTTATVLWTPGTDHGSPVHSFTIEYITNYNSLWRRLTQSDYTVALFSFVYSCVAYLCIQNTKEGNGLFNDALNTFFPFLPFFLPLYVSYLFFKRIQEAISLTCSLCFVVFPQCLFTTTQSVFLPPPLSFLPSPSPSPSL